MRIQTLPLFILRETLTLVRIYDVFIKISDDVLTYFTKEWWMVVLEEIQFNF